MRRSALVLALVFAVCGGPLRADSFEDGLTAFRAGEPGRAHDIWLPLAGQGDAAAQYSLGKLFEHGEGPIPQDLTKAVYWYRSAAQQGLPAAQNNLALMYAQGRGVPGDLNSAIELWRAAAKQNYPWAQYNLGLAYFRGQGVPIDQHEAAQWFRRAADGGLAEAQFIMGQLRREGLGLEKDEGRALAWYHRAADQGHLRARKQANALRAAGVVPNPPSVAETAPAPVQELAASLPKPSGATAEDGTAVRSEPQGSKPTALTPPREAKAKPETAAKQQAPGGQGAAKRDTPPEAKPPAEPQTAEAPRPTKSATPAPAKQEAKARSKARPKPKTAADQHKVEKPDKAETSDRTEVAVKAEDKARQPVAAAPVQSAALPADGDGPTDPKTNSGYRVWLASAGSKAQAIKLWQQVQDRHPDILAGAVVGYGEVDLGGQTLFRVLVGPLASAAEAEQLCERLRTAEPEAFCKVRAD